jgi:hypothetical protein
MLSAYLPISDDLACPTERIRPLASMRFEGDVNRSWIISSARTPCRAHLRLTAQLHTRRSSSRDDPSNHNRETVLDCRAMIRHTTRSAWCELLRRSQPALRSSSKRLARVRHRRHSGNEAGYWALPPSGKEMNRTKAAWGGDHRDRTVEILPAAGTSWDEHCPQQVRPAND